MTGSDSDHHYYRDAEGTIRDEKACVALCRALGDRISFGIIKSTIGAAKTATEISRENRFSPSSVYKKIKALERLGILQVQTIVADSQTGKRIAYYRCRVRVLEISMDEQGATEVRFKANRDGRHVLFE